MKRIWTRGAVLAGAVVVAIAVAASPAAAADIPHTHKCQNFGATNSAGYKAGHCANVWENISLTNGIRGHGEAFCQNAAGGAHCDGISQTVTIENLDNSDLARVTRTCGTLGGSSCPPAGGSRLHTYTPYVAWVCFDTYRTTIRTTVVLPVVHNTVTSSSFTSYNYTIIC